MKGGKGKKHSYRDRGYSDDYDDDLDSSDYLGASPAGRSAFGASFVQAWRAAPALKARNPMQQQYMDVLNRADVPIVIATGAAGTGKTLIPCGMAIQKLVAGDIKRIIITRPAVCNDEELGFLPGTLESKMDPYLRPIYDCFHKYMSPVQVQSAITRHAIEICPLAYMRGRTFDDAWICADEMQNCTPNQMLMLLTRIGQGSKLIVNGDPLQHDRKYAVNGLTDLIARLRASPKQGIQLVEFTDAHVERHPMVRSVLGLYGDGGKAPAVNL